MAQTNPNTDKPTPQPRRESLTAWMILVALTAFYFSNLMPNNYLNITLHSYAGNLHFGLVATQDLWRLDNLGAYIYEAFIDLENAVMEPLQRSG